MSEHDDDVVYLLERQHQWIRELLDEVLITTGDDCRNTFERLVRLLTVHETAEEEVIHPYVQRTAAVGGEPMVDERLAEEKKARKALDRLEKTGTDSPDFLPEFAALRADVLAHANAEETYEFVSFRRNTDPGKARSLAKAVRAAETALADQPNIESTGRNAMVEPAAALIARTRDAIRTAQERTE